MICGVGRCWGVIRGLAVGLSGGLELPLLKVSSYGKGWKNVCWNGPDCLCFSTL